MRDSALFGCVQQWLAAKQLPPGPSPEVHVLGSWRIIPKSWKRAPTPRVARLACCGFTAGADSASFATKRISRGWLARPAAIVRAHPGAAADAKGDDSVAVSIMGAEMLPTFRVLLATTGLAVLVVAVATYGLIPTPEVRTRIGEVPAISRSFIQEAMAPRVSVQALGDTAEERILMPEATGMASGRDAPLPLGTNEGNDPEPMTAKPPAPAEGQTESSDPLGDLIRATMQLTPDSASPPVEPGTLRPAPGRGPESPVAGPASNAGSVAAAAEPITSPAAEGGPPFPATGEDATGKVAVPADSKAVKAERMDIAPLMPENPAQAGNRDAAPANKRPTLAFDDEANSHGNASLKPDGDSPAAPSAATSGRRAGPEVSPKPGRRSVRRAVKRQAVERRRARVAAERRAARRQAVKRSRAFSSRKSRKTVRRVHPSTNGAAGSAARRGVYVVAPRQYRGSAAETHGKPATSPEVQHPSQTDPYRGLPNGYRLYYSAPAEATAVR